MLRPLLIVAILGVCLQSAVAQTTQPPADAAKLYLQAAKLIDDNYATKGIECPSSSNDVFRGYPPYPANWQRMEKEDFAATAEARVLAHQARAIAQANWPPLDVKIAGGSYLNHCRALANDLADAAAFQHDQGDDAAAVETLRDLWHLADLVENQSDKKFINLLVSLGIRSLGAVRYEVVASNVELTKDPGDGKDLQVNLARELIAQLLKHQGGKAEVDEFLRADEPDFSGLVTHPDGSKTDMKAKDWVERAGETGNRVYAECDMAAMSLACHLYRFDIGHWPKSLDDLHADLPSLPIDPWGDGKQTLGYVLIKGGLPDGSDRPLVYSRCRMKDGLFVRTDQPTYGFYTGDGSDRPAAQQKQGGQFRDVASWVPPEGYHPAATTQSLE